MFWNKNKELEKRIRKIELDKLKKQVKEITEDKKLSFEEKIFKLKFYYSFPMSYEKDRLILSFFAGTNQSGVRIIEVCVSTMLKEHITTFIKELK